MFSTFQQYSRFIFSGDTHFDSERGIQVHFKLIAIYLLLICLLTWPISYLADEWLISKGVTTVFDQMKVPELILSGLILAPLLEEIIFRSWLGNPIYIPAALAAAATQLHPSLFFVCFAAAFFFYIFFTFNEAVKKYMDVRRESILFWMRRNTQILVWTSCSLFGFSHASNYIGGFENYPLIWLPALLPQIAAGFFLAYVRMRVGLVAAMGWHCLNNCIALLPLLIWPS